MDIDHLRTWIGREETRSEVLTPVLAERFNATFDRTGPTGEGDEAPLLIHLCLCLPAAPTSELGPDGHAEKGGFLPPVPLPRRMWAGGAFAFHAPLRIGAHVTRRSVIRDVTEKTGRTGRLCFVTVEHEIASDGTPALTERHDIVYREAQGAGAPPSAPAAPAGEHSRRIPASPALLFRYSALTFNGHRIHYDAPYSTGTEGYPGLIVHGPMQATLLCQYAADLKGRTPARFEFRSRTPIFDTSVFTLNAAAEGEVVRLWTAAEGGPVAMEAEAVW